MKDAACSQQSTRPPVAVLTIIAGAILASGIYFAQKSGSDPLTYGNDFNVFYFAARQLLAGNHPYAQSLDPWTPYLYTPLLAEMLIPVALLPLPIAAYIWFIISACSVVAAAWFCSALVQVAEIDSGSGVAAGKPSSRTYLTAAAAVLLLGRFVLDNWSLGQVNTVVAALSLAHIYLFKRGRLLASGLTLAVAASIKLTPALLLFYHLARSRFRFAAACCGLIVAVGTLSFLPFGTGGDSALAAFLHRTIKNEQGYDLAQPGNQSLRGALARLEWTFTFGTTQAVVPDSSTEQRTTPFTATMGVAFIALIGLAAYGASRGWNDAAAASPFFCCMVLLSPLSWKAHFVVLMLPLAQLFEEACTNVSRVWPAVIVVVVFLLFNLPSPRLLGWRVAEAADAHSLPLIGALLVFCAVTLLLYRRRTREGD